MRSARSCSTATAPKASPNASMATVTTPRRNSAPNSTRHGRSSSPTTASTPAKFCLRSTRRPTAPRSRPGKRFGLPIPSWQKRHDDHARANRPLATGGLRASAVRIQRGEEQLRPRQAQRILRGDRKRRRRPPRAGDCRQAAREANEQQGAVARILQRVAHGVECEEQLVAEKRLRFALGTSTVPPDPLDKGIDRNDRLALLLDREASLRHDKRLAARLRAAKLRQQASVEDVDCRATNKMRVRCQSG